MDIKKHISTLGTSMELNYGLLGTALFPERDLSDYTFQFPILIKNTLGSILKGYFKFLGLKTLYYTEK